MPGRPSTPERQSRSCGITTAVAALPRPIAGAQLGEAGRALALPAVARGAAVAAPVELAQRLELAAAPAPLHLGRRAHAASPPLRPRRSALTRATGSSTRVVSGRSICSDIWSRPHILARALVENRHCLPTKRPGSSPRRAAAMTVGLETFSQPATCAAEHVSSPAASRSASVRPPVAVLDGSVRLPCIGATPISRCLASGEPLDGMVLPHHPGSRRGPCLADGLLSEWRGTSWSVRRAYEPYHRTDRPGPSR